MLRNCHLDNSTMVGDGDLLLIDPIRLSLNKLNLITGTEVIVLHSSKFLYSIKNIFSVGSKIYFIDISGNLYFFNDIDKKLTQIGNNGICKEIKSLAVYKNFLLTIENNIIFKTNLTDGNYVELKNILFEDCEYFFADNINIINVTKNDEIKVFTMDGTKSINELNPTSTKILPSNLININKNEFKQMSSLSSNIVNEFSKLNYKESTKMNYHQTKNRNQLFLKKFLKFEGLSKITSICLFRNNIIFYNSQNNTIESISIYDESHRVLIENFPEISQFINNIDYLACILSNGVIYKLYC